MDSLILVYRETFVNPPNFLSRVSNGSISMDEEAKYITLVEDTILLKESGYGLSNLHDLITPLKCFLRIPLQI